MECLDESTVLELLEGRMPSSDERRHHLAECDECRALVANVAKAVRSDPRATDDTSLAATEVAWGSSVDHDDPDFQAHFAPGTVLDGRYRVERILGSGGMGVVALATHTALDQKVAIKLLHPRAVSSPEAVSRFVREAKAAVRAFGDHVVRVLDVARLESGEPYIAMEFLVGKDARAFREGRQPSIEEIVEIVAQACIGVAHAHRAGIVHRDLKPANLFVIDDAGRDPPILVKVLDFGVSKVRRDDIGEDAALTRSTAFLGTPIYMAPEQVRTSRDVDARADVWAFGCILHELATGEAPFRRNSLGETCAAILVEEPPKLPNTISRAFAAIVTRCLAKDPSQRYADATALAGALAPLCSPGTREEIRKSLGVEGEIVREKKPVWPWAALAAAVCTAVAVFAWPSRAPTIQATAAPSATTVVAPSSSIAVAVPSAEPSVSAAPSAKPSAAPTFVAPRPKASASAPSVVTSASAAPVVSAPKPTASASAVNPEFGDRM